jgi:hypothetical protein
MAAMAIQSEIRRAHATHDWPSRTPDPKETALFMPLFSF